MGNRLSAEAQKKYVEEGGTTCPFCGAADISGQSVEIDNGIASQAVVCDECGEEWTDLYTLTGVTTEYHDYTCSGCGREESVCSADPCPGVIADRGEGPEEMTLTPLQVVKLAERSDLLKRIAELEEIIVREEISEANGALAQRDENGKVIENITTCGTCGKSWNDALISGRTPVPSARCPYEYIHSEIRELRSLKRRVG